MNLAVVGVEHRTCPVAIREALALEGQQLVAGITALRQQPGIESCVIVSTCARTELYLLSSDAAPGIDSAVKFLVGLSKAAKAHLWTLTGDEAVEHIFRVASGLESQILGEEEVVGQVRKAIEIAEQSGTSDDTLGTLFRAAIACSRRVRREILLPQDQANIAAIVCAMAATHRPTSGTDFLIIGAGHIARILCSECTGAKSITLASRNPSTSARTAEELGVGVVTLSEALNNLGKYDVVCVATKSRQPLIRSEHLSPAGAPHLLFDLGLPRNVDPSIRSKGNRLLFDIDDVRSAGASSASYLEQMESVVQSEVHDFTSRRALQEVGPIIQALREHVDRVRDQEIQRMRPQLSTLELSELADVEQLIERLMERMFHHLVIRLKLAALSDIDLLRAARFLLAHGDDSLFPVEASQSEAVTAARD
jgi:glutamyl-tRNA reductase